MASNPKVFSERQARFLLHLGETVAPGVAALDRRGQKRFRMIIRLMLLRRSNMERLQVRLFLLVLRWLPAPVFFRPFERIPASAQTWILLRFENAPIKLFRAGFWGLKTLIFMGYYGQLAIAKKVRYEPDLRRGNELLLHNEAAQP